jgi:hypothetical protein
VHTVRWSGKRLGICVFLTSHALGTVKGGGTVSSLHSPSFKCTLYGGVGKGRAFACFLTLHALGTVKGEGTVSSLHSPSADCIVVREHIGPTRVSSYLIFHTSYFILHISYFIFQTSYFTFHMHSTQSRKERCEHSHAHFTIQVHTCTLHLEWEM